jgi:archaellum component FlaG (FlaF/FlaG flagellin family)
MGVIIALVGTGALLVAATVGLLSVSQEVDFEGTITSVNVGLFLDQQATVNCTSMSWGGVYAGESASKSIYVKNTGNAALTLSMRIIDWIPESADGPVSMSWNRENYILDPGEVVEARLTLSISENADGISNFGYKMLVTGTA